MADAANRQERMTLVKTASARTVRSTRPQRVTQYLSQGYITKEGNSTLTLADIQKLSLYFITILCNRYRTPKSKTITVPVKIAEKLQEDEEHLHANKQRLVRDYLSFTFSSANNLIP